MEDQERKVFVCSLAREVDEEALRQYFAKYGSVWRTFIVRNRITNNSKCHGFVWFADSSSAKLALEDTTEHVILGKPVLVKKSIQKNGPYQDPPHQQPARQVICENVRNDSYGMQFRTKKIFVGGLPASLTREEFKDFFEKFGATTDVVIMFDNVTQRPRGFGFVTFESEESVENVMQNNYYILNGRNVEVKRAVPKPAPFLNWQFEQHGLNDYDPSYPSYGGAFPGYNYSPGFYSMYWPPYPVISGPPPPYGMVPFYSNGMMGVPGTPSSMFNPLAVKGNIQLVNQTDQNCIFSATEDTQLDNDLPNIGDLKIDADSEGERGNASS